MGDMVTAPAPGQASKAESLEKAAKSGWSMLYWALPGADSGIPKVETARDRAHASFVNVLSEIRSNAPKELFGLPNRKILVETATGHGCEIHQNDSVLCSDYSDKSLRAAEVLVMNKSLAKDAMNRFIELVVGEPILAEGAKGQGKVDKAVYEMVRDELLAYADAWREQQGLLVQGGPTIRVNPGVLPRTG